MSKMTLKALRVNSGLTQKEVAKALKVSNKTVSKWENGLTVPKVPMIDRLCDLYSVTYDDINFLADDSL